MVIRCLTVIKLIRWVEGFCYVSDLLTCKVNMSLTFTVENCFEVVVTVELSLNNNQKINVACLYRTPNSDITELI